MNGIQSRSITISRPRLEWTGFLFSVALTLWATSASAHQLWIESDATGSAGREQVVHVCWGHSGYKATGESLETQRGKLSARLARPDRQPESLDLALGSDSFTAKITPRVPGYYMIGAELHAGILSKEFHGIPANTRIVMYGKALTHVEGGERGFGAPLGMDLEIVPVAGPGNLHPGDIVTVKVLLKGNPLGGMDAVVSLKTVGAGPLPDDPRLQTREWNIEANVKRPTGEVSFPLIVGGQHLFYIKYVDENPGRYEGDREVSTEYSRLRKGDIYERTMYVSTFTIDVKAE